MKEQHFERWAPRSIIELWRNQTYDPVRSMFKRLLTWEDMRDAWSALRLKSEERGRKVEEDMFSIGLSCALGFLGPHKDTELTSSASHGKASSSPRDKLKAEICKTAQHLADLVRETGIDESMVCFLGFDQKKVDDATRRHAEHAVLSAALHALNPLNPLNGSQHTELDASHWMHFSIPGVASQFCRRCDRSKRH